MGIGRCFRSGGSSAHYQQDDHAQGSATQHAPHERAPYDPVELNHPAFAVQRPRVSSLPAPQRGVANNQAGLQRELRRAEELQSQIAAQVEQGDADLQPILTRLERILSSINDKLDGTRRGGSGPDEYHEKIEQVRHDFTQFNRQAVDPVEDFAHSGRLYGYDPFDRR